MLLPWSRGRRREFSSGRKEAGKMNAWQGHILPGPWKDFGSRPLCPLLTFSQWPSLPRCWVRLSYLLITIILHTQEVSMGKRVDYLVEGVGKFGSMKKKLGPYSIPQTLVDCRWIKDLIVKGKTVKIIKET